MVNTDPQSKETLEDLHKVLVALPRMPKNIVDDTRHEKVLSYVSAFIAQGDRVLLQTMLGPWAILDLFQDCLVADQDYRVGCVALRLLGVLLEHDITLEYSSGANMGVWLMLESRYPTILSFMLDNTQGEEALTRYSCWFALERAVKYDGGAQWLLNTGKCADMVKAALEDSSTYVLTAACQFLVAVIENKSICVEMATAHDSLMDTLLESISLYSLIHTMMTDQASERNRLAGLEFLWMVTDSRTAHGEAFMKQSKLYFNYLDLLMDDSRLVRSRSLDVLSILLESTANPLDVLGIKSLDLNAADLESKDLPMLECYTHLLDHDVLSLMSQTDSLKALHVATGILDALIKPLWHCEEMHGQGSGFKDQILSTILWIVQAIQEESKGHDTPGVRLSTETVIVQGSGKLAQKLNEPGFQSIVKTKSRSKPDRGTGSRGGTLPKTVALSSLKALQSLALLFPEAVEQSAAINTVLSVLYDQRLCADQRVFKSCLTTLPIVLKTKVQGGRLLDSELFSRTMTVILNLVKRPASGSTSLRLILTAVQEFFADNTLGQKLTHEEEGRGLANGLGLKLYDMEWDVRDNVVEFIGSLFASGGPDYGVEWALKYDLLESIFQKLSDEEAYVRAASVHAFEMVMRDTRGWKGMCAKNLDERLGSQLPVLVRDSEAFVRRAVLEAMICLVSERESGIILMVNGTDLFVDAQFMSRLTLDDADWEVRIKACEFLAAVWEHCIALDERADYRVRASKRIRDSSVGADQKVDLPLRPSTWWFYDIKGDQILIEATKDASRLVRLASVETCKKIKAALLERLGPLPSSVPKLSSEPSDQAMNVSSAEEVGGLHRKRGGDVEDKAMLGSSQVNHPHGAFYRVLSGLDFERLDATTSVEHLYEEVFNVERVEDVVMAENENPNDGNNVLDCY